MRQVAGIVLAAGAATRLGQAKQLLPLAGRPIISYVLEAARQTHLSPLVVVLGAYAGEIEAQIPELLNETMVVRNDRYAEGQSTSLQAGIRVLPDDAEAALILLADQPEIQAPAIEAVLEGFEGPGALVVQAEYPEGPGHPVLLARRLFPELLAIEGDTGARGVTRAHADQLVRIPVPAYSRPEDIDTEDDYQRLLARIARRDRG